LSNDGVVVWRFVDVDYRTRAEPDDIIAALDA
ncbi:MAG: AhpC/TSA family protein, partial [bacterium]|nr:AhpC/TSA family protein [bacterium]